MAIDTSKAVTGASTDAIKNFVKMVSDHRNLLDNPWFTINQRGWESGSSYGYMLDRWIFDYGTGSSWAKPSTDDYITIRPDGRLIQRLEPALITYLRGKTVTASIIDNGGVIHSGTAVVTTSSSVNTTFFNDGFAQILVTYDGAVYIYNRNGSSNSIGIKAVKLELGSVSTLQYDAPPNPSEELLKCQRYFYKFEGEWIPATTALPYRTYACLQFPVRMRVAPDIYKTTISELALWCSNAAGATILSGSIDVIANTEFNSLIYIDHGATSNNYRMVKFKGAYTADL